MNALPEQNLPLFRDRSFGGMTATQFLGAFNDNLFKQLVLLICVDYAKAGSDDQWMALGAFAVPFVLFSGFAGYLSDRNSKRRIVVLCKVAEIAVMAAGLIALLNGALWALILVLFLMSTQSAYFGPAKYGILPELFREKDLPQVNGVIQMTTFLAIIFGMALAGFLKDWLDDRIWLVSTVCISIAALGTLTALTIRGTPIAHPGLPMTVSSLTINWETWMMLRRDRNLMGVLVISSLFWFLGGVVQTAVNAFGKLQLHFSDGRTSMLAVCMGTGIAIGCVLAGRASRNKVSFRLVAIGSWGIFFSLATLVLCGMSFGSDTIPVGDKLRESLVDTLLPQSAIEWLSRTTFTVLGIFAGLFVVPMQVFMQARPSEDQKGRMIGAMNLINWIGILLSALFYFCCWLIIDSLHLQNQAGTPQVHWIFAALALVILPVAVLYRPGDGELN